MCALAALISSLMWICALVLQPDGLQVVAASALRARGDNWFPTFSHILAYAGVMPVLGYWLAEHRAWAVAGLLFAIFWSSVLSAVVLLVRWWAIAARRRRRMLPEAPIAGVAEGEVRDARRSRPGSSLLRCSTDVATRIVLRRPEQSAELDLSHPAH